MTPKEKAKELFGKMCKASETSILLPQDKIEDIAQECASIAVDEILRNTPLADNKGIVSGVWLYWVDVLKEINKL